MSATWYSSVVTDVANAARDLLEAIGDWAGALSAVDLVLIAAGGAAIYWLWSTLHAINRLGPVEVAVVEQDGPETDPPKVNALTAKLRERLGHSGLLPPPAVPSGSPQTNLIAAVEATGTPQSAFAAKLLELLPQAPSPPEFTVQSTLIGPQFTVQSTLISPQRDAESKATTSTYGLAYWLQPKRDGPTEIGTVERKASFEAAIEEAAADIFLAISREAVNVFPAWSQWDSRANYLTYMKGVFARVCNADAQAERHFEEAATAEPGNVLPRLQLVNLLEKRSAAPDNLTLTIKELIDRKALRIEPGVVTVVHHMFDLAAVLGGYLDIATERPDLVAARYRASVVGGVLATVVRQTHQLLAPGDESKIRRLVGEERLEGALAKSLEDLSGTQSKEVKRLLRLHHVLVRHARLRHQFEPRGFERRQLMRTVAIGRHARRIRTFRERPDWRARWGVAWRRAWVRVWHISLGIRPGWNARYNAGCFYATLYDRALYLELQEDDS